MAVVNKTSYNMRCKIRSSARNGSTLVRRDVRIVLRIDVLSKHLQERFTHVIRKQYPP